MSARLIRVGGVAAKERKVSIVYKDSTGKTRQNVRWLSQVQHYVDKYAAAGFTDFRFQLHSRAPWHTVQPTKEHQS